MFFDAFALYFRGGDSMVAYYGVRISNLLGFCCGAIVPTIFLNYLIYCFKKPESISCRLVKLSNAVCAVFLILYLVNLFIPVFYSIDGQNIYHREPLYPLTFIPGFINIAFSFYLLFKYKALMDKSVQIISIVYLLIPIPGFTIQMFVYGLNLVNFTGVIIIVIIFLFIQSEQSKSLLQQELALSESKNALVLSQIQPHFMYNTLTSIYRLCDIKPEAAKDAISDFAKYLRGNLDSMGQTCMIPFTEELKHLQAYLALEKMRYDDDLEIVYDIRATQFLIPPLTVQPLAENAVKHGLGDLPNGGRITISSEEKEGMYLIRITDTGVGFQVGTIPEDRKTHIGISNVKNRLQIMCQGTLEIISSPGNGTTAVIRIPK